MSSAEFTPPRRCPIFARRRCPIFARRPIFADKIPPPRRHSRPPRRHSRERGNPFLPINSRFHAVFFVAPRFHFPQNVLTGLRNVLRCLGNVLRGLRNVFRGLRNVLRGLRNVFRGLRNVLRGLRNALRGLRNTLRGLRNVFRGLRNALRGLRNVLRTIFFRRRSPKNAVFQHFTRFLPNPPVFFANSGGMCVILSQTFLIRGAKP